MMEDEKILLNNLEKVHTTKMGVDRIKRNLKLDVEDVVRYCVDIIKDNNCKITKRGKIWYINNGDCIITVNTFSYTIITAHKVKKQNK